MTSLGVATLGLGCDFAAVLFFAAARTTETGAFLGPGLVLVGGTFGKATDIDREVNCGGVITISGIGTVGAGRTADVAASNPGGATEATGGLLIIINDPCMKC